MIRTPKQHHRMVDQLNYLSRQVTALREALLAIACQHDPPTLDIDDDWPSPCDGCKARRALNDYERRKEKFRSRMSTKPS